MGLIWSRLIYSYISEHVIDGHFLHRQDWARPLSFLHRQFATTTVGVPTAYWPRWAVDCRHRRCGGSGWLAAVAESWHTDHLRHLWRWNVVVVAQCLGWAWCRFRYAEKTGMHCLISWGILFLHTMQCPIALIYRQDPCSPEWLVGLFIIRTFPVSLSTFMWKIALLHI